ncbi:unnamed protein product [Haemonchus placei]|uniref:Penicillin-binding protein 2 n=1 Tax=Haemonchus placei TaxID=6290 RepID=A0A0N4VYD9_HAEPC|nr:unnamed protein product [Haemonchus placei]
MTAPPGIGAVRQATQRIEGLDMTEDQQRRGTEYIPWYSGQNKFATQAGSGGFLKVRDVIVHSKASLFRDYWAQCKFRP